LTGVDETYEQTVHARTSYRADEIVWNARFQSVFRGLSSSHLVSIDVSRLNDIEQAYADAGHGLERTEADLRRFRARLLRLGIRAEAARAVRRPQRSVHA